MALSRVVSAIDAISVENRKIFPPLVYCAPLKVFPLEMGTGAGGQKTRMMGLPGRQIRLTITSAMWIECTNVTDRRTDGQRATAKTALTSRRAVKMFSLRLNNGVKRKCLSFIRSLFQSHHRIKKFRHWAALGVCVRNSIAHTVL